MHVRANPTTNQLRAAVVVGCAAALLFGCDDNKANRERAASQAADLAKTIQTDADQVRKGMPGGAAKLGELLAKEANPEPARVQESIAAARAASDDLRFAKSTFFAMTNPKGVVIRSEVDPDSLVDKNVFTAFGGLEKAATAGAGLVEVFGEMEEVRGVKRGKDLAWVVGHPVVIEGEVRGAFISGWSLRAYAYYLEQAVKRSLLEESEKMGEKSAPLAYAFVVKGANAYGAPDTPDVDAEAVEKLDVVGKTAGGPWTGSVEITRHGFGVAAERAPALGDDAAVAVLVSSL